ncbi:tRNA (adenosine(37)-N6)-dimethylallyltransferase MiaA [Erythrobacter arachoides]|uniref:tRNA dimethylallyltransferase n=1 Tax=Aurantiacibacter arachoides TaxID=1850444 RepID=A0A844ZZH7_9SPHN|nr:tRNA (adenosine(37)-N6)-dimethylallyltransferase MiaA [Aurantiacibacter arachoides]MXO93305.1 tRNA (adenosine(37)-N6)-dimethylallyltransferase MiaA [Aurantiacibacter arachoides]GGD50386.1 tRNA dimethylallyltransferase [Aurantiacibacter arachoides]
MSKAGTPQDNELALIAGPTASGKSDLAVRLALALHNRFQRPAIVINADSAQVYANLHVLSARPSEDEMKGVPHRLFGTWDGAQACSAADWAAAARREIADAHQSGAVPILVGGTGLYIRTLLDGIAPVPAIDPGVRAEVRAMELGEAFAALRAADPDRAAKLAPADSQRITRALEVVRSTGQTLDHWQRHKVGGIGDAVSLAPLVLLPDRATLFAQCDARFAAMVDGGAVAEVEALLARQLDPTLPVMRAIGVPEIAGYLRGDWPLEQAVTRGQQATRNYAKRQFTWLRHQLPAGWLRHEEQDAALEHVLEILLPR